MINESDEKSKKEETKEWIRKREQRKGNGKIIIMRFYENNLIKPLTSYSTTCSNKANHDYF